MRIVRLSTAAVAPWVLAALLFGPVASEASVGPVARVAADTGRTVSALPASLSGAQLAGRRLTVTASCERDGRIAARVAGRAPTSRTVTCHRGETRAVFRLAGPVSRLKSLAVTLIVRTGGRPAPSRLLFGARAVAPPARSAQLSHGSAMCTTGDHLDGSRAVIDIGINPNASFGLRAGTGFAWESWIYYVNAGTGARGYQRYGTAAYSYAPAYQAAYQRWYPYPGYWIHPMLHVVAPGGSVFDSVAVNGAYPYPARTSQWCLW